MRFDELNEDNYVLFAIKNYDNPQAATKEDFFEDMRRFKYIKRLLKKYHKGVEVKLNLLLNHIIIIYNVFGDAAPLLLFYKNGEGLLVRYKSNHDFFKQIPCYWESKSLKEIAVNDCILEELKQL